MFVFLGAFAAQQQLQRHDRHGHLRRVGYIMVLFQWPRPPFVLGLVLGTIVENYLWISSSAYGAAWLVQPTVVCIFLLMVGTLSYSVVQTRRGKSLEDQARKGAEGKREVTPARRRPGPAGLPGLCLHGNAGSSRRPVSRSLQRLGGGPVLQWGVPVALPVHLPRPLGASGRRQPDLRGLGSRGPGTLSPGGPSRVSRGWELRAATAVLNSAPLFAVLLAMVLLDEEPGPANLLGAVAVVGGLVFLSWKGESRSWRPRDLFFPASGALLAALRDNMVRFGLLAGPAPMVGATITVSASFLIMSAVYFPTHGLDAVEDLRMVDDRLLRTHRIRAFRRLFPDVHGPGHGGGRGGFPRWSIVSRSLPWGLSPLILGDSDPITRRKGHGHFHGRPGVLLIAWSRWPYAVS